MQKQWYFTQEAPCAAYNIYNPNKINAHVCQVCGKKEAEEIVNTMNSQPALLEACEEARKILTASMLPKDIFRVTSMLAQAINQVERRR